MAPPVTVVGDVHLAPEAPAAAQGFLAFLDAVAAVGGGTLVLLGDVFDWWVGRKQVRTPFAAAVLARLRAVAHRGVRLGFVAGNRDFAFDGAPDLPLEIWPDVVRTRWGERVVVLSHGDLLCSEDRAYLRMRRLLRSAPARGALRALPLAVASYLARGLRDLSERSTRHNAGARAGIDYGLARRWLEGYEAELLVLGHVHTGVHHRLPGPGRGEVIVVKDWHERGGVVRFDGRDVRLVAPDALPAPAAGAR
jgi:UDP-2,3-diacylglucosamine hydrolase